MNHCLRDVVDADTIMVNEYSFRQEYCPLPGPGSLLSASPAGGLGWGFGAALGAKLAARDRQVIAVLGDGAYMFANPTACHFVGQAQNLPVLVVIYNNTLYGAVRRATLDMFEHGVASEEDGRLLADLGPAPAFERMVEAHGGHGERVERPGDLPGALETRRRGRARWTPGGGERPLPRLMHGVLVVGAGPVGLTLAMDLAWRGIDVPVLETRDRGEPPSVKCNHVAARTMEVFRRLGVARAVREADGLPADYPNDVSFRTTTTGIEFARIHIPCRRDRYTDHVGPDGWWPTPEPPHRINQIYLEPVLFAHAVAMPGIRILNRTKLIGFEQSAARRRRHRADTWTAAREPRSPARTWWVATVPHSEVRRAIGARLAGDAVVQRTQSTYIRAPDLIRRMQAAPAWSTQSLNPRRSANMFAIDGRETWLIHNYLRPDETNFEAVDRDRCIRLILGVGPEFDYEVISKEDWIGRRMVADRFRRGRVFICGDAAHIWVPFAGYGMNAGIADAMNLSWMLAGVLKGWADPAILARARGGASADHRAGFALRDEHRRSLRPGTRRGAAGDRRWRPSRAMPSALLSVSKLYELNVPQYCCGGLNFGYFYRSVADHRL